MLGAMFYIKSPAKYPLGTTILPKACHPPLTVGGSAATGETFFPEGATHQIETDWEYYGPGYRRGPGHLIISVLVQLMASKDVDAVWYANDQDADARRIYVEDIANLVNLVVGERWALEQA